MTVGVTFAAGASSSFYSERIDCRHCLAGESSWRERGSHKFAKNEDETQYVQKLYLKKVRTQKDRKLKESDSNEKEEDEKRKELT